MKYISFGRIYHRLLNIYSNENGLWAMARAKYEIRFYLATSFFSSVCTKFWRFSSSEVWFQTVHISSVGRFIKAHLYNNNRLWKCTQSKNSLYTYPHFSTTNFQSTWQKKSVNSVWKSTYTIQFCVLKQLLVVKRHIRTCRIIKF